MSILLRLFATIFVIVLPTRKPQSGFRFLRSRAGRAQRRRRMKRNWKWSLGLSIVLSAGLVACEEPYHAKEEQYYFISANINIPYWQEAQAGLTDAAKYMGVKAEMDGPTTLSPKDELDSFQKAVALHPAGILVSVSNAELFKG